MFVLSKGFYNKSKKTVSVVDSEKIGGDLNASSMTYKLKNVMDDIKHKPDNHKEKLKGINLKRGPKSWKNHLVFFTLMDGIFWYY